MDVFAYCARTFSQQVRRAAGVSPLTCPPLSAEDFPVSILAGRDLIYFDLHGPFLGSDYWTGDNDTPAITAAQIRKSDLTGAVIFATNCYLGDAISPMLDALLAAGARGVIAGAGRNWSPAGNPVYGAGLLGLWLRRLLAVGMHPARALEIGKRRVSLAAALNPEATKDTLNFRLYQGRVQG